MATIITFAPSQAPVRTPIRRRGYQLLHRCEDASGTVHRQKLPLGSLRGITHLDAMCIHCGAHFVWVEDHHHTPASSEETPSLGSPPRDPGRRRPSTAPGTVRDSKN